MTAIAVTIAGSDSGGGAGIQADLKTFSALKVYGASVITALTAQNTQGVQGIHDVPADFIAAQMDSVFSDLKVDAVKIGMLSQVGVIETVAAGIERHGISRVVLDPVMVAASGDRLLSEDAIAALRTVLLPHAAIVTPNLPEAAAILGEEVAQDEQTMLDQGKRILAMGPSAVLIKGGHGSGPESTDLLIESTNVHRFPAPRIATKNTHGTGCTLSSAIAAKLALGYTLHPAVEAAKAYISAAIAAGRDLDIGQGHGPVHHFHSYW